MRKELQLFKDLESLTGEGSQKAKQRIISENQTEKFLYLLDICFNPFVTTKLHKISFNESLSEINYNHWDDFKDLAEELKRVPAANDLLRKRAQDIVSSRICDDEFEDLRLREVLMKIITKRMNIGIGAKLINKSIGKEIIPDPSLMLATADPETLEKWDRIYCEEKYDGVRVIALWKDHKFSYFTRAFNELDSACFPELSKSLETAIKVNGISGDFFFDGELTDLNRKSVSGKVTQILKGKVDSKIEKGMIFNVFDLESSETLIKGKGDKKYKERRKVLENILKDIPNGSNVTLAQMWEIETPDQIASIYKNIIDQGGEGVICKNDEVYECKRSKSWVKFKEVNECDLIITGWYPGEGKREGFIGGFFCEDSEGIIKVKVGSGFTDHDLQEISKDPDSHINKVCSVLYNVIINDKNNNWSLFLPRFVELRHDKDVADDMRGLCK